MRKAPAERLVNLVNRSHRLNGKPFAPGTPMPPPAGRHRNWVHYGVMVPNLPEPHRLFGVMAVLGTPGVTIFDNDHAVTTTPGDTAYVVSATAAMTSGQFSAYSISRECDLRPDGSHLRFGKDVVIDGTYPHFTVRREHPQVTVELDIHATDTVSHFVRMPGVYDHWSLLARYTGHIEHQGSTLPVEGLCTVEYACGLGMHSLSAGPLPSWLKIPGRFFTYHVVNVDETTQVLLVQVLGPSGLPIQKAVYVRSLDDHGAVYSRGFDFTVHEYAPVPATTPDGRVMRLPQRFAWKVQDDEGGELIAMDCTANADFAYGLGAGYVGSYRYQGRFRDRDIAGCAYIEYIDGR